MFAVMTDELTHFILAFIGFLLLQSTKAELSWSLSSDLWARHFKGFQTKVSWKPDDRPSLYRNADSRTESFVESQRHRYGSIPQVRTDRHLAVFERH
jgi:hypothetical protein